MRRFVTVLLVGLVLTLGGVACGNDDDGDAGTTTTTTTATEQTTTDDTTTEETTTAETTTDETTTESAAGRDIFVASCGGCHALADAGTSGGIGPGLDGTTVSSDDVEQQVREGGNGMPAFEGVLDDDEIEDVSEYVSDQD